MFEWFYLITIFYSKLFEPTYADISENTQNFFEWNGNQGFGDYFSPDVSRLGHSMSHMRVLHPEGSGGLELILNISTSFMEFYSERDIYHEFLYVTIFHFDLFS